MVLREHSAPMHWRGRLRRYLAWRDEFLDRVSSDYVEGEPTLVDRTRPPAPRVGRAPRQVRPRSQDPEAELTCQICTDVLYQPVALLNCLHTFCGHCLKRWLDEHAGCPTCRVPPHGAVLNRPKEAVIDAFLQANRGMRRTEAERREIARIFVPGDELLLVLPRAPAPFTTARPIRPARVRYPAPPPAAGLAAPTRRPPARRAEPHAGRGRAPPPSRADEELRRLMAEMELEAMDALDLRGTGRQRRRWIDYDDYDYAYDYDDAYDDDDDLYDDEEDDDVDDDRYYADYHAYDAREPIYPGVTYTQPRQYRCRHCRQTFPDVNSLRQHSIAAHSYTCNRCGRPFFSESLALQAPSRTPRLYYCWRCDRLLREGRGL